ASRRRRREPARHIAVRRHDVAVVWSAGVVGNPGGEQFRAGRQPRADLRLPVRPLGRQAPGVLCRMSVVLFWLLILVLFALTARLGQRLGLIPIVSQLLTAAIGVPILM